MSAHVVEKWSSNLHPYSIHTTYMAYMRDTQYGICPGRLRMMCGGLMRPRSELVRFLGGDVPNEIVAIDELGVDLTGVARRLTQDVGRR